MSVAAERRLYRELNALGIKPYDVTKIDVNEKELVCHLSNGMVFKSDDPYLSELAVESKLRTAGENQHLKRLYGLAVVYGGEKMPFSIFAKNMASASPKKQLKLERELEKKVGSIPYETVLTDKVYAELSRNLTYTPLPFTDLKDMNLERKLNMLAFMSEEGKTGSMAPFMR